MMQFDQLNRREFITLFGSAAAWPLVAHAQQVAPSVRSAHRPARIAFVSFLGAAVGQPYGRALRDGLRALGWFEGRNAAIARAWSVHSARELRRLRSSPQW